jgi:hypothetical protein
VTAVSWRIEGIRVLATALLNCSAIIAPALAHAAEGTGLDPRVGWVSGCFGIMNADLAAGTPP